MDDRKVTRKTILALRDALSWECRQDKSALIRKRLWDIEEITRAKHVMIYVNFRSEVETMPLFQEFFQKKMQVSVPLTIIQPPQLIPYLVTDPDHDLRPGYCGIQEPDNSRLAPCDPRQIDVVLVPGSVFDPHGGRLGYGGGYYDRFFASAAPNAVRVALAFELQVVDSVPLMEHDMKMDYLLTEEKVRKISGAGNGALAKKATLSTESS